MIIGIIGNGREGRWWQSFLGKIGYEEIICSDCSADNPGIVVKCEVVFLCVPMDAAEETARQVAMLVKPDTLVISTCGIMRPVEDALQVFEGDVVLLHRMIGPQVETMKGHPLIVNLLRLRMHRAFVEALLEKSEGNLVESDSESHDQMVGLTQGLVRILLLAYGKLLLEAPLPVGQFTNIPFGGVIMTLARILDFGPELSFDMIFQNQSSPEWIERLRQAALEIESSSQEDFRLLFDRLEALIGSESVKQGSQTLAKTPMIKF